MLATYQHRCPDYRRHGFGHHRRHRSAVPVEKGLVGTHTRALTTHQHRAQRLVAGPHGSQEHMTCPYHGWVWDMDGSLLDACDRDDFPEDPVGKIRLTEVRVATWAGLVWYTMDDEAPDLLTYLAPTPELYKNHQFERTVRVNWLRVALNANWKFWSDNFNESYHTRTVLSDDAEAKRVPSGLVAIDSITRLWAWSVLTAFPVPTSQTRIIPRWSPLIRRRPAGWKARALTVVS